MRTRYPVPLHEHCARPRRTVRESERPRARRGRELTVDAEEAGAQTRSIYIHVAYSGLKPDTLHTTRKPFARLFTPPGVVTESRQQANVCTHRHFPSDETGHTQRGSRAATGRTYKPLTPHTDTTHNTTHTRTSSQSSERSETHDHCSYNSGACCHTEAQGHRCLRT